MGVFLLVFVE